MQDTLIFILKNIVTNPDQVTVEESLDETGTTLYLITVSPDDVGRIIGKEGKVIKAIRTLMRVIAIQKGLHVRISVNSESAPTQPSESHDSPSAPTESQTSESDEALNVDV